MLNLLLASSFGTLRRQLIIFLVHGARSRLRDVRTALLLIAEIGEGVELVLLNKVLDLCFGHANWNILPVVLVSFGVSYNIFFH